MKMGELVQGPKRCLQIVRGKQLAGFGCMSIPGQIHPLE
jgi:hypothetical protein